MSTANFVRFVHDDGRDIFQTGNLEYIWYPYQAHKVAHNENEIIRINGDYLHLHCVLARLQKLSTAGPECTDVALVMWRLEMVQVRDKVQALLEELEAINRLSARALSAEAINAFSGQALLEEAINGIGPVRLITRERAWRISNESPYLCRSRCLECWLEEGLLKSFRWKNKAPQPLNPRAPCFVMRDRLK